MQVPKGWEKRSISSILTIGSGKDYKHLSNGNIPVYGTGGYMTSVSEYLYDGESVCIGRKGTINKPRYINGKFWTVDTLFYTHSFINSIPKYIYYNFLTIDWYRYNEASGVPSLSKKTIEKISLLLPPLEEQQKIAAILSTWDKAINITEKMIANSQEQKKALMQQLLTGKKRLYAPINPNFSIREGFAQQKLGSIPNDWKVDLIKKYLWYQEGPGVRKHQFTESGVKLFNGTNIQFNKIILNNTSNYISEEEAYGTYSHFLVDANDLLIACSGISIDRFNEKIAFIYKEHLPLCMNTSTMRFKVKDSNKMDINFYSYFMQTPVFKNQIRRQATGSAQLNFGPSHIAKCYVFVPSLKEQEKIAEVLTTADQEIKQLKQKLKHLKQEKKALMQQLLTGKRRVEITNQELLND